MWRRARRGSTLECTATHSKSKAGPGAKLKAGLLWGWAPGAGIRVVGAYCSLKRLPMNKVVTQEAEESLEMRWCSERPVQSPKRNIPALNT